MKKIITHLNPDLDAVASAWLIKKFLPSSSAGGPGWEKAKVEFISAGPVEGVDTDPDILYVDVGQGKLDHHQTGEYLSAAKLCFDYVKEKRKGQPLAILDEKALEELVAVVTEVDNARDLSWPEAEESRYQFYLNSLIDGLDKKDEEVVNFSSEMLDIIFSNLKKQIKADETLREGIVFKTSWGKAIAVESGNKEVKWRGQVLGYVLVVRKDPDGGGVRIYARPDSKVDLIKACRTIRKMDPHSDWFLHSTRRILLNQSASNPDMRPTKLSLKEIVKVLKKRITL